MGVIASVPKLLQKIEKQVAKAILRRIWTTQTDTLFTQRLGNETALSRDEFQVFAAIILIGHGFKMFDENGTDRLSADKIREYLVRTALSSML